MMNRLRRWLKRKKGFCLAGYRSALQRRGTIAEAFRAIQQEDTSDAAKAYKTAALVEMLALGVEVSVWPRAWAELRRRAEKQLEAK